jgi:hypothetical protein
MNMRTQLTVKLLSAMIALMASFVPNMAVATNITPYYLTDGDAQRMWIINSGVASEFTTYSIGYPIAVTNSVWLGHRDDNQAREYSLAGAPTGNTSSGGNAFSQLLDGTTNGAGTNYGVECCGSPNSVTTAAFNWAGQTALFNISGAGTGIAFDTATNSLFVSTFSNRLQNYTTSGALISDVALPFLVSALAYEQATNTLWAYRRGTTSIVQFSMAGALLQTVGVTGANINRNVWGGEMVMGPVQVAAPAPAALALFGFGLVALGAIRRRRAK